MIELVLAAALATPAPTSPPLTLPEVVRKVEPTWPVGLLGLKTDSRVTVQAVIGIDGIPRELTVLSTDDERLNEAALEAVGQWRYRPAVQNGHPVQIYMTIVLHVSPWSLKGSTPPRRIEGDDPQYPRSLLPEQIDGDVRIRLKIGTDGTVLETKVIASDHAAFTEASLQSIAAAKYAPAMRGGKPVVGYLDARFDFRWKRAAKAAGTAP